MGTSLNGLTPAVTYPGLIKTGDNAPIDGTLKTLSDGNGNNLPMALSTTAVNFTNQLQQGGVAVPTAGQVNAKQDTLISGTNIKTINGATVLGSGNIAVVTSPSGVSGAIQFSNGSAFASDATNLFWDDTNNRLGIGTNAPASALNFGVNSYITYNNLSSNSFIGEFGINNCLGLQITGNNPIRFLTDSVERMRIFGNGNTAFGSITDLSARLGIKGSGSTSATTSLLVQNSAGTELFKVQDNGTVTLSNTGQLNVPTGGILSGGGVKSNDNSWGIGWQSPSLIGMRGDTGRIGFSSDAVGSGAVDTAISRNGAGILEVNNGSKGTLASINVASYRVNGTIGFTGTGSYTNFTIVGGIITNAS